MDDRVRWCSFETKDGTYRLAGTSAGICRISLPGEDPAAFFRWLAREFTGSPLVEDPGALAGPMAEIRAYLEGSRRTFRFPLDLRGTPFQRLVWEEVARVPYGETVSYGEIARRVGRPGASRAVGAASQANPLPLAVPCHRVVGSDGRLVGYGSGLPMKERFLRLEGCALPARRPRGGVAEVANPRPVEARAPAE